MYMLVFGLIFLVFVVAIFLYVCLKIRKKGRYPKNIFLESNYTSPKKSDEEISEILKKSLYESEEELKEKYDVVVIGSGISASVTAGLLSRAGKKVLVLEKHDVLGGYGHCWWEGEYEFCAGFHFVFKVEEDLNKTVFNLITDNQIRFVKFDMDEIYAIGDKELPIPTGTWEGYKDLLFREFPDEKDPLTKFFALVEKTYDSMKKFIMIRNVPWYIKYPLKLIRFDSMFHKYGKICCGDVLDECGVKNDRLRWILTVPVAIFNTNGEKELSFAVHSAILHEFSEKYAPIGSGFAKSIYPNLKNGSVGICNCDVKKILLRKDGGVLGVELSTGRKIHCPTVISSTGIENTLNMIPSKKFRNESVLSKLFKKHRNYTGRYFVIYLGLDVAEEELGMENIGSYYLCKKGKWDDFNEMKNLKPPDFDGFEDVGSVFLLNTYKYDEKFRREFPKKTKMIIVSIQNEKWFERFEGTKAKNRGNEYYQMKQNLTDKCMNLLYDRFPKIEDHVEVLEAGTNLTLKSYGNWPTGSIFGIASTYEKLVDFVGNDDVVNPIKGLYLVGQDLIGPGLNLSGIISSLVVAGKVIGRNMFGDIMRSVKHFKKEL